MTKVIKDDDKFICKKEIPKNLKGDERKHWEKSLYCEVFELIKPENGVFYEYEYIEEELPKDTYRYHDHQVLLLIVKKYKLDQSGFPPIRIPDKEY